MPKRSRSIIETGIDGCCRSYARQSVDFRPLERLPIERAQFEAISNQVAELDTQANRENGKSLYTRLQTLLDSPANFPDRESSPDSLIDSLVKQRNAIMPATVRESDSP